MAHDENPTISFATLFAFLSGGMLAGGWGIFMGLMFSDFVPKDAKKKEQLFMSMLIPFSTMALLYVVQLPGVEMYLFLAAGVFLFVASAATFRKAYVSTSMPIGAEARIFFFSFEIAGSLFMAFAVKFGLPLLVLASVVCFMAMYLYGWLRFDRHLDLIPAVA